MACIEDDSISAAENTPISKEAYNQIPDLKHPGETLARLVEKVNGQQLTDGIKEAMAHNEFVELDL